MNRESMLLAAERLLPLGLQIWAAGIMIGEGVSFAGIGATLVGLIAKKRQGLIREHAVGLILCAVWIVYAMIGSRFAVRPLASGAPFSAVHIMFFGLAWIAMREADHRTRQSMVMIIMALGAISGALAVLQHYREFPAISGLNRLVALQRVWEPAEDGGFKAGGLHFHRLRFVHTLVPILLATIPLAWRSVSARGRLAVVLCTALSLAGMYFAFVRAAWVALLAGVVILGVASQVGLRARRALAVAALALLTVPFALILFSDFPVDRQIAWRTALQLFAAHPFFGSGYGGYTTAALQAMGGVPDTTYPAIHIDAHSLLLQVFAQSGVVGLCLHLALAWRYGRMLVRDGAPSAAMVAALTAASTLGIVHNWFFHPVVMMGIALAFAMTRDEANGPQ